MIKIVVAAFIIIALTAIGTITRAQNSAVSGTVYNAKSGKPLSDANVYLDNTTIGTTVDSRGRFKLDDIPDGLFNLVVSFVGYRSFAIQLKFPNPRVDSLNVLLKPKTHALHQVTVNSSNKKWKKNLARFKWYFLGRSPNAEETIIENPLVLNFENKNGTFVATASKPLKIKNEALGYHIRFNLQKFVYNGRTYGSLGHSKFSKINPKDEDQRSRWREARRQAYHNSFRHFIHALVHDSLRVEGYALRYVNQRKRKLNPKQAKNVVFPNRFYRYVAPHQIAFFFTRPYRYLRVDYYKGHLPERLGKTIHISNVSGPLHQLSWIKLPNGKAVIDTRTGSQIPRYPAVLYGFWSLASVIPNRLPLTYHPPRDTANTQ